MRALEPGKVTQCFDNAGDAVNAAIRYVKGHWTLLEASPTRALGPGLRGCSGLPLGRITRYSDFGLEFCADRVVGQKSFYTGQSLNGVLR